MRETLDPRWVMVVFIFVHIVVGFRYYVDSITLAISTLWFIVVFLSVGFVPLRIVRRRKVNEQCRLCSRVRLLNLKVAHVIVLTEIGIHLLTFLLAFVGGWDIEELRQERRSFLHPSIILFIHFLAVPSFLVITIRAFCERERRKMSMMLVISVLAFASTSRSNASIFIFIFMVLAYYFKLLSLTKIIAFGAIGTVLISAIKIARVIYSDNEYSVNFYIINDLYVPGSQIETAINITLFQLQDMAYRAWAVFEYIPDRLDYQLGRSSFFGFYSLMPGEQVNPHRLINHNVIFGTEKDVGYPPTTVAQMYLDFSYVGVILLSLIISVTVWFSYLRFYLSGKLLDFSVFLFSLFVLLISFYGAFDWFRFVGYIIGMVLLLHVSKSSRHV